MLSLFLVIIATRTVADLLREWAFEGLNVANIAGVLPIALFALAAPLLKLRSGLSRPWLIFAGAATLAFAIAPTPAAAAAYAKLLSMWAVFEMANWVGRRGSGLGFEKALVVSAALPVAIGIYQYATGTGVLAHNRLLATAPSIFATFNSPNTFSFFLVYAALALVALGTHYPRRYLAAGLVILLCCLAETHTKVGWMAALFAAAMLVLRRRYLVLLPVALAVVVLAEANIPLPGRVQEDFAALSEDRIADLGSGRVGLWEINAMAFVRSPVSEKLFGAGLETVYANVEEATGNVTGAHSDFLRVLMEGGLVLLAAWSFIWYQAWLRIRRVASRFERRYGLALLAAGLVVYALDNSLGTATVSWAFWGLVGAFLGRVAEREAAGPDPAAEAAA